MRRCLHGWLAGPALLLALAGSCVHAADAPAKASPLDSLLKMEGIDGSYALTCRDVDGKAITRKDFDAAVLQKHLTFSIEQDPAKHTAELRLNPAGSTVSREIHAMKAAAGHFAHAPRPGQPLPAFHLAGLDGRAFDNASLRGRTTLVNFFFSTCAPCIAETPVLSAYARAHPEVRVLAVTFDDAGTARGYVAAHHFDWPVLADGMGFIQAMGVSAYPAMALVGPDGRLERIALSSDIGSPLTVAALQRWVKDVPSMVKAP